MHSRREFVAGMTTAASASLFGLRAAPAAAEPPPETTKITLDRVPSVCLAPQYVAEDLLRADGFTDVRYVNAAEGRGGGVPAAQRMAAGEIDIGMNFAAPLVVALDRGASVVVLAGVHIGCFELVATDRIRSIKDLKGKTVAVFGTESAQQIFLSSMATLVGLDPSRDITWVVRPSNEAKQLLAEGKIDAFLGFPPDPQELRARKIGHVIVNSATDRPWSQYFCCMVVANRDFVTRHPAATKRVLRAILKADQICAVDPARGARAYLDRGFAAREDYALQALKDIPYGRWREYDPVDTLRFYALRLYEAGMIRSNPQKIIAQGTDWRFLNELKRELKA